MSSTVDPIGGHEGVELAEAASYYIRRNIEARSLLEEAHTFPSIVDSSGTPLLHYETMVIQSIETVDEPGTNDGQVRLSPALPINGARDAEALAPIEVTLLEGTEVRCGFIALLQRMSETGEVGMVYFFSDDLSSASRRAA